MRYTRLISALVALVLTALLPIAATTGSASAQTTERAKEKHALFAAGKEIRNTNKFIAYGRVSTYKNRRLIIQRKNCGKCKWKHYKKVKTNKKNGKFRTRITPGKRGTRVCYLVKVPSTKRFATTKRKVGCITTY